MRLQIATLAVVMLAAVAPLLADAKPETFVVRQIGTGVYAVIVPDGSRAGGNAGFVIGDDGVLVIDTLQQPDATRQMLNEIRKLTKLPVRYVVNTHYHIDHVAGNGGFAATGAIVAAQQNVRAWIRTENLKFFGPAIKPEMKQQIETIALPELTYRDGIDIYLGSRHIMIRSLPGHTGGDSIVVVPDANIVFCGDLLWNHHLPNLIDASTAPWLQTLDRLGGDYRNATFVPGHGDVAKAQDVTAFHDYLQRLRALVAGAQKDSKTGDALIQAVLPQLQAEYGSWGFFTFAKRNIEQTAADLAGTKKLPAPIME